MPSPLSVVAVSVPVSGTLLPVASTLTMSMPLAPLISQRRTDGGHDAARLRRLAAHVDHVAAVAIDRSRRR